jgi:GTPase SAR1 family protein
MEKKFHYRDEPVAQQPTPDYKICLLGEVGVGKTCFFCTVGLGKFPTEYIPSGAFEFVW